MAEKKIYVTHDYQPGAKVANLKLEDQSEPVTAVAGQMRFDSSTGQFHVFDGSEWDEVVTNESFGVAASQVFDNKSFDGGGYATG